MGASAVPQSKGRPPKVWEFVRGDLMGASAVPQSKGRPPKLWWFVRGG